MQRTPIPFPPDDALTTIPDPVHVRWVIGVRYAEILVLKQLLRAAESRSRLFPGNRLCADETRKVAGV